MDSSKANLVLEKNDKNLGLADPAPLVWTKSQVFPWISFEGFPNSLGGDKQNTVSAQRVFFPPSKSGRVLKKGLERFGFGYQGDSYFKKF